ncbi:hypothetical protein PNI0006_01485 [Streptococcus pneumoniae PNI0006]|nr:hypothetical protein PNI0006_01485 [Streptococcus pneumoniae PNI0006]
MLLPSMKLFATVRYRLCLPTSLSYFETGKLYILSIKEIDKNYFSPSSS